MRESGHDRPDVRPTLIKIPCGLRLSSVKKGRKSGGVALDERRPMAHLVAMIEPDVPRAAVAQLRSYVEAVLMVAASTLVGLAIAPRWGNSGVDLLYLPAVLGAALLGGIGPALVAAALSALAYNFFFTAPHLTFRIDDPNELVTVIVLFVVAVVTSQLAAAVRRQARIAQAHAQRNATIAGVARELLGCTGEQAVLDVGTLALAGIFDANVLFAVQRPSMQVQASAPQPVQLTPTDIATALLVLETGEPAGRGLSRAVPTEWQFHPVRSGSDVIAAFGLARNDGAPPLRADQLPLLDNLLDQVALALERSRLEAEAREFAGTRARDRVRSALLASIGHDLKPPLAAITRTIGALRRSGSGDKALLAAVGSEAAKMERYLRNLADLSIESDQRPLEAGGISIDLTRRAVSRDGHEVHLTPKEYAVFAELAKHPGRVLTHAQLLRAAWGPAQESQTDYLRVAIRALRQKLEADPAAPQLIVNEPAVGYMLKAD
jgi:two-component system, OmpR family, sensor histidine kinase KdpD